MSERGSEWRRWDLHVHTPGTAKNDQYSGCSLKEKWDNFYDKINEYVNDENDAAHKIVAIGITDYLSIDNYLKVIQEKRLPESIKLVIPNVEMRLSLESHKQLVNIHFLFDPTIVSSLQNRFFSKLIIEDVQTRPISANKEDLIELGRTEDKNLDKNHALKIGIEKFNPSLDVVIKLFKADPELRNHTLIGVANSNNDGASGMKDSLSLVRKRLYNFVDFIFSGNPNDRDYFLGKGKDSPNEIKQQYRTLKPCLHGSDAHCLEKLFCPDDDRYCWIKAEPTFNGLKQILYEPEQRVYISQDAGDFPYAKKSHQIIDHIEFQDTDFTPQIIYLNPQLNCIIGGKSTGKSLLLHNIARAVDKEQVNEKLENGNLKSTKEIDKIRVVWKDGSSDDSESESKHKILYIPQTYLNRLSDEDQEKTEIDKIVESVLFQNSEIKAAYNRMQRKIEEEKQKYNQLCMEMLYTQNQISDFNSRIKAIGTQEAIEQTIRELEVQKDSIGKEAAISSEEIQEYETLSKEYCKCETENEEIRIILDRAETVQPYLTPEEFLKEIWPVDYETESKISAILLQKLKDRYDEVLQMFMQNWQKARDDIYEFAEQEDRKNKDKMQENKERINALKEKLDANASFKKINDKLISEKKLFKRIQNLNDKVDKLEEKYRMIREDITGSFENFVQCHEEYADFVNCNNFMKDSGLNVSVKIVFRKDAFINKVNSLFDKRNLRANKDVINTEEFNISAFSSEKRKEFIERIIDGNHLKMVKNFTVESSLREIFTDWYNTNYTVTMGQDQIGHMSPGKKALVLLKLMISLANSNYPILIDQPEDDLDNRSIFKELIPFIVNKKQERQFIIVTHNANVVLGADAEEVIIANQHGDTTPNKDGVRFAYLSGAIENDQPLDTDSHDVLESRSIQEHICDILEGGKEAFELREKKYHI